MELGFVPSRSLSILPSSSCSSPCSSSNFGFWLGERRNGVGKARVRVRASADRRGERVDDGRPRRAGFVAVDASSSPATSNTTTTVIDRSFGGGDADFLGWEKLGAVVRLSYGIGIYGAMALAGKFICEMTGVDCTGGFHPSLKAIVDGLGYAAPPIMALLFILDYPANGEDNGSKILLNYLTSHLAVALVLALTRDIAVKHNNQDEVVKYSPHARAIRDVEDEELRSFFYGMSPWQFILIIIASSVGEELFYRVAVQGALTDMFLRGTELVKEAHGMACLTGMLPLFVPFAQAFAAVITAALTGSLYYVATAPKDPTYVVAPVLQSHSPREDLKKLFAAWYERRQMKKIYSPLLEGLLALYLGFEWMQTDNILAPMITHGIYSSVILGYGLWKIHHHRRRLRHRIQQIKVEARKLNKF